MIVNDKWAISGMDLRVKTALNNILVYLRKPPYVVWKKVTETSQKNNLLLTLVGWKRVRKSRDCQAER